MDALFVLVGGWPGSGKSTLAAALGPRLGLPVLAKDEIKEALVEGLGLPDTVSESRRLGRAAVLVALRVARSCPGAVLDSTWFDYTRSHVAALPGRMVEVRCTVPVEIARSRYYARAANRHATHLDLERDEAELWGKPVLPLGVGPVVEVDTTKPTDIPAVAADILRASSNHPSGELPG
jgi:predicted kinase